MLIALTLLSSGCASRSLAPESLPVDHVECASCRMIVSTAEGSGQIVSAGEEPRFYDDVGCLAAQARSLTAASRAYVFAEGRWIEAAVAFYARPAHARTAMGSGWTAFPTEAAARAADANGRAESWSDVLAHAGEQR